NAFGLSGVAHAIGEHVYSERTAGRLDHRQEASGIGRRWVVDDDNTRHGRCDLLEQLQPFGSDRKLEEGEPSDIAPGMRKAGHKRGADRISNLGEYGWDGASLPLDGGQGGAGSSKDHFRLQCHELGSIGPPPAGIAGTPTVVDLDIEALGPS